jgi:DNA transformation protein
VAKTSKPRSARSLAVSDGFKTFVLDQLRSLGGVTARAMFGGAGLYCEGTFFGILARDKLYLKVGASNRGDYEREGAAPFVPYPGRGGSMAYFEVPLSILESPIDLVDWARKSIAVAASAHR